MVCPFMGISISHFKKSIKFFWSALAGQSVMGWVIRQMMLLAHVLFPLNFTFRFIWIFSYIVRRNISYSLLFNMMQNRMVYVQSFALIKSTGVRIYGPGTVGISIPTAKHSFTGVFRKTSFRRTLLRLIDLTDTDFNEHRCILIILMISIFKNNPLN